ncbi:glycoside hydrolase family 11 protein [Streptomyces sp. 4N509B]|uniref:glycoside hydrolase family 11 protein n=1 Tax=Streptomyces sp. 4N509B TaxID=3457413 RepID=UPI003FD6B101
MDTDGTTPSRSPSRRTLIGGAGALALGASTLARPGAAHAQQTVTRNETGTHEGFFYSFWTDGVGSVAMTLTSGGSYSTRWSEAGSFLCGKGWSTGSRRTVTWSGDYRPTGDSFLCLYGWSTNPLVEYHVVDSYGARPPIGAHQGSFSSDGATYDLHVTMRHNAVSVEGIRSYPQFWSVNQSRRTSGTIDTGAHFDAWADAGMRLGHLSHYMILATEGYLGSGTSALRVS